MSGKPKKLKELSKAEYWKIIQRFYNAHHKSGTNKSLDYKDKKYSTKAGEPRKETIEEALTETQKQFIARAYRATQKEGKSTNKQNLLENTARSLRINTRFLDSMSNIFSSSFLEPVQPEQIAEALPEQKKEPEVKTKPKTIPKINVQSDSDSGDWTASSGDEKEPIETLEGVNLSKLKLDTETLEEYVNRLQLIIDVKSEEVDTMQQRRNPEEKENIERLQEEVNEYINRFKLQMGTNRRQYETYEQYIERLRLLLKLKSQISDDRDTMIVAREMQDILALIRKTQTQIRARDARKAARAKQVKEIKKISTTQSKKLQDASEKLASLLGQQEQKAVEREEKAIEQRKEIKTAIQNINDVVRDDARATEIKNTVLNSLRESLDANMDIKRDVTYKIKKPEKESKLSKENINQLIGEIPEKYRNILAPTVRSLFSGNSLNANTIVSGIVGMGLAMTTGSPIAGRIGLGAFNFLRESLGINFNDMFQPALPPPTEQLPPLPRPTVVSEKLKPIKERKTIKQSQQDISEFLNVVGEVDDDEDLDLTMYDTPDTPRREYAPEALRFERIKGESDVSYVARLESMLQLAQENNDEATAIRIKNIIANLEEFVNPFQIETKHSAQIGLDLAEVDEKGSTPLVYSQTPVIEDIEMKGEDIKQNTGIMGNIVSMLTGYFSRAYNRATDQTLLRNTIDYLSRLPVTALPLLFQITKGKNSRDRDLALATAGVVLTASMDRKRRDYGAVDDIPLEEPLPDDYFDEPEQKGRRGIQIPRLVRPTLEDVNQGVTAGTVGSALGGMLSGGASGAIAGVVPGGMAGAIGGGVSASALRTYFNQRGEQVSDKKIQMLAALPTAMLGAYLGYQGTGKELVSGAVGGITEQKINVDADVLKSTKAQESQDIGKNRQWFPKIIAPTPAILDKPAQEAYAEDLEAALFNYVAPTSEGADGTVFTNQLKRNQYMNEQLRYYKSGVMVPHLLWGKILSQANMTPKELDTLALGQKPLIELPQMEFIPANNETTWDTVADKQYVNGELDSIEFLSPYSSYSNVDNYWNTNAQSVLYTINP